MGGIAGLAVGSFEGGGGGGDGEASGAGNAGRSASARASRGAMIAFSTLAEPQTGQVTRPRFFCLSKACEF